MAANNRSGCNGKKAKVGTGDVQKLKETTKPIKKGWRDKMIKRAEDR